MKLKTESFIHRLFFLSLIIGYTLTLMIDWGIAVPETILVYIFEENYFYEVVSCLFIAVKIYLILKRKGWKNTSKLDRLLILTGVFIIGEENSWGYHIFNYSVGPFLRNYNLQQETNIHNIDLFNGLMVEALFYSSLTLLLFRSFFKKEFRELNTSFYLRIIIFIQFIFLITDSSMGNFMANENGTFTSLDMNEELLEYTISYYILNFDSDRIEEILNTKKNGLKAILFYR